MAHSNIPTTEVAYQLVADTQHYSGAMRALVAPFADDLARLVYRENDAYGPLGFVPPQGRDWSGLRDSSEAAHARMGAIITALMLSHGVEIPMAEVRARAAEEFLDQLARLGAVQDGKIVTAEEGRSLKRAMTDPRRS